MENHDLEHGNVGFFDESAQRLLDRIEEQNRFSPLIVKVPDTLRELSEKSFSPREVSIGPLHYYDIDCEMQKECCLIKLLNRIKLPKKDILKSCMEKVYNSMEKIFKCYGYAQVMTIDHNEFADMMVMDACFILEFCNKISGYDRSFRGNMVLDRTIIYDLVLLENQIPFFILEQIFQCTILKFIKPPTTLLEFIRPLLNLLNIFQENINIDNIFNITENDHILSILYQCYKPRHYVEPTSLTSPIHSAADLGKAGVNFKPTRNPKWILEMDVKLNRFSCCFSWCCCLPTLSMPVLYVHDFTELVLRNLIAYEQQSRQTDRYIISYACAMDMLVNTQEDVAKLIDSKVLVNSMDSNEEAAKMINSIRKEVSWDHSFYGEQLKMLNYPNSCCQKNIAELRNAYCRSPLTMIALLAGIIVFALTVVQTIFTIKSTGNN